MRAISYTCDRCGKPIQSRRVTKLDAIILRGMNSKEKKSFDFCTACFLKVKKAWTQAINMTGDELTEEISEAIFIDDETKKQETVVSKDVVNKGSVKSVFESEPVKPKKRGRKPKPVDESEWTNRTELFQGVIKPPEKKFILKLYVEDGLSPEEIADKVHRIPKGIKRAITTAERSGELDILKAEFEKTKADVIEEDSSGSGASNSRVKSGSYVVPAYTEVIDGKKYDIGGILALHKAGWQPSMIADEKNYDEDTVRIILETHK